MLLVHTKFREKIGGTTEKRDKNIRSAKSYIEEELTASLTKHLAQQTPGIECRKEYQECK